MADPAKRCFLAFPMMLVALLGGCDGGGSSASTGGGGTGGQTGGTGGQGGGEPYGTSAAGVCFEDKCSSEISACKADPECPAYLSCLEACPVNDAGDLDTDCASACPKGMGSQSMAAASAVDACRTTGAGAACLTCTRTQPDYTTPVLQQTCPDPSMETNVCFKCEDEKCCETYVACKDNAECQAIIKTCLPACAAGDTSCEKNCVAQHPDGADDLGALFACMRVRCFADQPMCDRCQRGSEEVCLFDTCAEAYATYLSGKDGYALEACIHSCPIDDMVCDQGCYSAYPDAKAAFDGVATCAAQSCAL